MKLQLEECLYSTGEIQNNCCELEYLMSGNNYQILSNILKLLPLLLFYSLKPQISLAQFTLEFVSFVM